MIREAEQERRRLVPEVAAMNAPTVRWDGKLKSVRRLRGATYATWFRAIGALEKDDLRTTSPNLLDDEELDYPKFFHSHHITGQVKWNGFRTRRSLLSQLNMEAPWGPRDFRDIYPHWEYTYELREYIGGVLVRINQYRAAQPRRRGWHAE